MPISVPPPPPPIFRRRLVRSPCCLCVCVLHYFFYAVRVISRETKRLVLSGTPCYLESRHNNEASHVSTTYGPLRVVQFERDSLLHLDTNNLKREENQESPRRDGRSQDLPDAD
jgi:hypothetical protein